MYDKNRNKVAFEYFFYKNGTKKTYSEMKGLPEEEILSHEMVYIQHEEPNKPLMYKYALLIFMLIFVHGLIFFYLPFVGNMNLQNSYYCEDTDPDTGCNFFGHNPFLVILYLLFCLYFTFSALQVSYGLCDMRKQALLMRGDNVIYSSAFKVYKAIPFLYELKLTLDWTLTPTSLDLFKWLKFESVYDLLFLTHCLMKANVKKKVGTAVAGVQKLSIGMISFIILLLILLGPLILFSNLNPIKKDNNVIGGSIGMEISFNNNGVYNNYTLYKNDFVQNVSHMNNKEFKDYNYIKSGMTKNFPKDQIQVITFFPDFRYYMGFKPA